MKALLSLLMCYTLWITSVLVIDDMPSLWIKVVLHMKCKTSNSSSLWATASQTEMSESNFTAQHYIRGSDKVSSHSRLREVNMTMFNDDNFFYGMLPDDHKTKIAAAQTEEIFSTLSQQQIQMIYWALGWRGPEIILPSVKLILRGLLDFDSSFTYAVLRLYPWEWSMLAPHAASLHHVPLCLHVTSITNMLNLILSI